MKLNDKMIDAKSYLIRVQKEHIRQLQEKLANYEQNIFPRLERCERELQKDSLKLERGGLYKNK